MVTQEVEFIVSVIKLLLWVLDAMFTEETSTIENPTISYNLCIEGFKKGCGFFKILTIVISHLWF